MKQLKITKERFNSSRYFRTKYGELKYMSEDGRQYKTTKGQIIQFNEGPSRTPDFGAKSMKDVQQTGDLQKDFNLGMTVLNDDNYEAFVRDLNTLASDTKVKNIKDAILKLYEQEGQGKVEVQFSAETDLVIKNFHPTQYEVDINKSLQRPLKKTPEQAGDPFSGKPIKINNTPLVVTEIDNTIYIIDGHHRWSQTYCLNPNAQMTVRILRCPQMFKTPDDVLKYTQMKIWLKKGGQPLPWEPVEGDNLYTATYQNIEDYVKANAAPRAVEILTNCFNKLDQAKNSGNDNAQVNEAEDAAGANGGDKNQNPNNGAKNNNGGGDAGNPDGNQKEDDTEAKVNIAKHIWANIETMQTDAKVAGGTSSEPGHARHDMP